MSDLTQWTYKRSHSITSGTELTDYQVKIRVYRTEGTSTGDTVYLGSKCLADYGDIRFVASDDTTELSYWMETNAGTYADFWVKVPSITSDSFIYIYYGNSSASTTSNGYTTFIFFDDFSTNTIGVNWIENYSYTGAGSYMSTHTIENGGYHAYQPSAADRGAGLIKSIALTDVTVCHVTLTYTSRAGRSPPWVYFNLGYNNSIITYGYWGSVQLYNPNSPSDTLDLVWTDGKTTANIKFYRAGSLVYTGSASFATNRQPSFLVRTAGYETINLYYKNFYVTKYASTEPTHSAWSEEQEVTSYPLKITITPTSGTDPLSVTYNCIIPEGTLTDFVLNYGDGQKYTTPDTINTIFEKTRNAYTAGFPGCTFRSVLSAVDISSIGTVVRFKMVGPNDGMFIISHASIVERDGSTANGTTIPTEVTFNNGESGFTLDAGISNYIYSDWITYTIDETKDYLFIVDISLASTASNAQGFSGTGYYKIGGATSWNTQNLESPKLYSFGQLCFKIETRTPTPQSSFAITHVYNEPGTYTVWGEGYTEFATHVYYEIPYGVTVNPQSVIALYTYEQLNNTVTFHDESIGNPSEWFWTFGDGTWSYTQNPIHTYPNTGIYHGTLHVSNQYQYDNTTFDITVITVDIDQSKFYICPVLKIELVPHTVTFKIRYTSRSLDGYTLSYTWDFGDGIIESTSSTSISHTYTTTGVYYPTCTIYVNEVEINTVTGSTILLNIPSKTLYERMSVTDHHDTFYIQILLEYLEMMDICAPTIILYEKLGMIQRKFREHLGIDEFGHHVTDKITSFGHSLHGTITEFGHKIIKAIKLNQRGFTTCDFVVLEETLTLEHDIDSISEFAT